MEFDQRSWGRIGVLMGGVSSEKEISLKSGRAILKALKEEGCNVLAIEIDSQDEGSIIHQIKSEGVELVFIALHGRFGEDGQLQELLEKNNLLYTGSGPHASYQAFHKNLAQKLFQENGLQVPPYIVVDRDNYRLEDVLSKINLPVFVKPSSEGSSIGVSCARDAQILDRVILKAGEYGRTILVEKAINGRELTVGILDGKALAIVEIRPKSAYFDFAAKYELGTTEYIVPAVLPEDIKEKVQKSALRAFHLLGCQHFARIDFMLNQDNEAFILEANTIPGFTSTSLLPKAAKCGGISFNELCLRIVGLTYGKKKKDINTVNSR